MAAPVGDPPTPDQVRLRRACVINPEWLVTTPPTGYGAATRLAFAAARELGALGISTHLYAPRIVDDPGAYPGISAVFERTPTVEELEDTDVVYLVDDRDAYRRCPLPPERWPQVLYFCEDGGLSPQPPRGPNIVHVVFRGDRLPRFPPGRARLGDHILMREEIGPPQAPQGYVAWIGRICRDKGLDALVSFAEAVPEVRVRVAGPVLEQRRWPKNIELIGEVGGAEKRKFLTGADAFLYTVNSRFIGSGEITLTEAASCGIPILAQSFSPGTPANRCVIDRDSGFVHSDPRVLARLLPLAREMDRHAIHRRAFPRYAPSQVAKRHAQWMEAELGLLRSEAHRRFNGHRD